MPRVRVIVIRVVEKPLFECLKLRGKENEILEPLLYDIKNGPIRATDLEAKYGIVIYKLLEKLTNSGLVEKTTSGYILSTRFSDLLRKYAEEWENFVWGFDK